MSEEIKDLLETLVLMERNNLDHLIRTGQAIKWRKGIEQLQKENKKLKDTILTYQLHTDVAPNSHESINGNELICNLFTENKKLKEQNESLKKYYEYDNKSWKNLAIKQANDLEIKDNILTEFEKWLEEEAQKDTYSLYEYNLKQGKKQCLDKLQELKGSDK